MAFWLAVVLEEQWQQEARESLDCEFWWAYDFMDRKLSNYGIT